MRLLKTHSHTSERQGYEAEQGTSKERNVGTKVMQSLYINCPPGSRAGLGRTGKTGKLNTSKFPETWPKSFQKACPGPPMSGPIIQTSPGIERGGSAGRITLELPPIPPQKKYQKVVSDKEKKNSPNRKLGKRRKYKLQ